MYSEPPLNTYVKIRLPVRHLGSLPMRIITVILLTICSCITPSIRQTKEQTEGDRQFREHRYDEAVEHYLRMLEASSRLGIYRNTAMEADVWRKIANCREMTGRYEEALDAVRNALRIDSADGNVMGLIEDYRQEGMIHTYMGLYYRAMGSLERSLSLSEGMESSLKSTRRLTTAETYLALGKLYAVTGRSREALDYTGRSLTIFRQSGDRRGEMESYLNLAAIYSDAGDLASSRRHTESSMKIAMAEKMGTSRHNQILAGISLATGEYESALRFQEKALEDARAYGIAAQVIWATVGLGDIYSRLGDLQRAEKLYNDAREAKDTLSMTAGSLDASLSLRMGDTDLASSYFLSEGSLTGKAVSELKAAEILILRNKPDSATVLLRQAAADFSSAGNLQGVTSARVMLGKLSIGRGDLNLAESYIDSALAETSFPETSWQAWFNKGRICELKDNREEAIRSYRNSIEIIERMRGNLTIDEFKSSFFNTKREVYDRLISILMKKGDFDIAFTLSEQARARAFYDILSNRKIDFRGSLPGSLISLEQEKRVEMEKLFRLIQKTGSTQPADDPERKTDVERIRSSLQKAQEEYEELLQKIKLNNPAYAEMVTVQPVSTSDIRSLLDPGTALLAYWIGEKEIIVWMVTGSGVSGRISPADKSELSAMIEKTRIAIRSNNEAESARSLSALYDLLILPYEKEISGFSNLVIIPNGALHFLPFQALMDSKGDYLVEKYNLIYSPSAGVFRICNDRDVPKGSRFMGLALSDISVENRAGLPGTKEELNKILPLFPDNKYAFGLQATETFVKDNAPGSNFIHFATHGSYNYRQPLYSYLLFPESEKDDGRLNVYEVFEMKIDARLVTLSACETGLGNLSQGDELVGLSRAFLFAGSSSVIVSLWAVADYPTSLLMSNFYHYLKSHPMQEALTLAQRDVIRIYPQPMYWSPFILIGNGTLRAD